MDHLPAADLAVIDEQKVTHYLLSSGHSAGRTKAAFFSWFGFRLSDWERLRDALLEHAHTASVIEINDTEFGRKYMIEGALRARDGRRPQV